MSTTPILILGGAGKTGRRIATRLASRGVEFQLASRSSDTRFDWYDQSSWPGVIRGSDTAYLAPPVDPHGLEAAAAFVDYAAGAGLRRLVLLSGRGVGGSGREFAVYHSSLALEQAVTSSGLDWTIVRPAWFMQNFSEDFLREQVLRGELRMSTGSGADAWIDAEDIAEVITEVLLDEAHTGQTYELSGPQPLTLVEVAAELAAATGRQVSYVPLDPDQHVAETVAAGVAREEAEALRDLLAVIRHHRSAYVSDGVVQVLGRAPREFGLWAREAAVAGAWTT